jgi:hypothetical protein
MADEGEHTFIARARRHLDIPEGRNFLAEVGNRFVTLGPDQRRADLAQLEAAQQEGGNSPRKEMQLWRARTDLRRLDARLKRNGL